MEHTTTATKINADELEHIQRAVTNMTGDGYDSEGSADGDYSGRSMYGRTCLALYVDDMRSVARVLVELCSMGFDELAQEMAEQLTTDSMGLGIVAYFPHMEVAS